MRSLKDFITESAQDELDNLPSVSELGTGTYTGYAAGYVFKYNDNKYKMPYGIRCPNFVSHTITIASDGSVHRG